MIYATDLDRTLIFSDKFLTEDVKDYSCVEEKEGKPLTYMCLDSQMVFETLKQRLDLRVIPITTRSVAEYKRVQVVQDCKFAITSNGGTILYKNKIFLPWKKHIKNILGNSLYQYSKMLTSLFLKLDNYCNREPRLVDNVFFVLWLKKDIDFNNVSEILKKNLDTSFWMYTIQGFKLYIIPKDISKENALRYLSIYLKEDKIITSGDGKLDLGFLKMGKYKLIPENSEVLKYLSKSEKNVVMIPYGLNGTIELLNTVNNLCNG